MPQIDTPGLQLRIYCICGQKMRVSSTMFGRPGKCIACRQKIRVPRLDEIPPDVTEIYLKDHPEFLRKVNPLPRFSEVDRSPRAETPNEVPSDDFDEPNLGDGDEPATVQPLDPLEPLRLLCSLEEKVERLIEKTRREPQAAGTDRATLIRYRALVRNARSAFDDQLRDQLIDAADQLANTRDAIARAIMSLRVGELAHDQYLERIRPLRAQRDNLERRAHNLRGWLATGDSALAGGYVDARLEEVPVEPSPIPPMLEARNTGSLLQQHVESLRAAMRERASAERKLAEWQRIERERALPATEVEAGRRESEAIRLRAAASVAFCRACIEQAVQDAEQDNKAIRAFLDAQRGRLQTGDIDANTYRSLESKLVHVQNDNGHARDFARRALAANSAADLPRASSTLLERLAAGGDAPRALGWDTWIAWGASVLMVVNIAVPITRQQTTSNLVAAPSLSIALFAVAGAVALMGAITNRALRASLLNITWVAISVLGAGYLHETWHGDSPLGLAMRSDPSWFTNPGMIMLALCAMLTGLAAATSVLPVRDLRRAPAMAGAVILILLSIMLTDLFGQLTARPRLGEPNLTVSGQSPGEYEVRVILANEGWRSLQFGAPPQLAVQPAVFLMERQLGPDSWSDVTLQQLYRDRLASQLGGRANAFPMLNLAGGEAIELAYHLPPGNYRVQVQVLKNPELSHVRNFTLTDSDELRSTMVEEVIDPSGASTPPTSPTALVPEAAASTVPVAAPLTEEPQAPAATPEVAAAPEALVQLQGVINAAGRDPRFIVILTLPGEEPVRKYVALGEVVAGPWKAAEFNPEAQTLTLSNDQRLLVLDRGVEVSLGIWSDTVPPEPTATQSETSEETSL